MYCIFGACRNKRKLQELGHIVNEEQVFRILLAQGESEPRKGDYRGPALCWQHGADIEGSLQETLTESKKNLDKVEDENEVG